MKERAKKLSSISRLSIKTGCVRIASSVFFCLHAAGDAGRTADSGRFVCDDLLYSGQWYSLLKAGTVFFNLYL